MAQGGAGADCGTTPALPSSWSCCSYSLRRSRAGAAAGLPTNHLGPPLARRTGQSGVESSTCPGLPRSPSSPRAWPSCGVSHRRRPWAPSTTQDSSLVRVLPVEPGASSFRGADGLPRGEDGRLGLLGASSSSVLERTVRPVTDRVASSLKYHSYRRRRHP
jgi:hypothetical protein